MGLDLSEFLPELLRKLFVNLATRWIGPTSAVPQYLTAEHDFLRSDHDLVSTDTQTMILKNPYCHFSCGHKFFSISGAQNNIILEVVNVVKSYGFDDTTKIF